MDLERVSGGRATSVGFDVPADSSAPRRARIVLAELAGELDDADVDTLKLLVTELVTNSVRHCRGAGMDWTIGVDVDVRPESIYVEVTDPGAGFVADATVPDPLEVSGRGLFLVRKLASRWGITSTPSTTVWFELPLARARVSEARESVSD